jgi:hypothetical protein
MSRRLRGEILIGVTKRLIDVDDEKPRITPSTPVTPPPCPY